MPIEKVDNTELTYYLISFDAAGRPRARQKSRQLSDASAALIHDGQVTDVFLLSHGWKGDVPAAIDQYYRWIEAMAAPRPTAQRFASAARLSRRCSSGCTGRACRGATRTSAPARRVVRRAGGEGGPRHRGRLLIVDPYADRIADTPARAPPSRRSSSAALEDIAPGTTCRRRCARPTRPSTRARPRQRRASPGGAGRRPRALRPRARLRQAQRGRRRPAVRRLRPDRRLLSPLRQLSFWKMKDRARTFGETARHRCSPAPDRPRRRPRRALPPDGPQLRLHRRLGHARRAPTARGALPRAGRLARRSCRARSRSGRSAPTSRTVRATPGYFHRIVAETAGARARS